ncbi:MAG: hypothetical protein AB201_03310 [Parcubacteria bacterium C7867-006]|nr:MAG: hypothetical protein AB201_03310 [Parcubacteria bacterium C7867-006]
MKSKYFYLTVLFSVLLAVLPFLFILKISNWSYPKIPVQITDDSIFYYTRAMDVYKGHPFIGNPYVSEYKDSVSANFFVADWLWSAPLFLGFSINQTTFLNQIIWFIIFSLVLSRIFAEFDLGKKASLWGVLITIFSIYWYLSRPVAMQVVYPFFLGFILLLFLFIKNPNSWKRRIALGIYSGIALYMYTYLAYIMAIIYVLVFGYYLFKTDKKSAISIFISGSISLILAIPFIYYTWLQTTQLYYSETVTRLGLLYTHSLSSTSLVYFFICFLIFISTYLYKEFFTKEQIFIIRIVDIALVLAILSNTVIGIDFELAQHIGRFVDLYICIFLFIFFVKVFKNGHWRTFKQLVPGVIFVFIIISIIGGQVGVWKRINNKLFINDSYAEPLSWLKDNTKPGSVILANDSISEYIPLLTNDYVVFNNYVGFHIMSDGEVEDRYLVSRMYSGLDLSQIKNDFRKFAGVGNAVHQYNLANRNSKICFIFKRFLKDLSCKPLIGPYDIKGEEYFNDLKLSYDLILDKKNDKLKEYGVSYILVDKEYDKWNFLKSAKLVWSDDRYFIYKI